MLNSEDDKSLDMWREFEQTGRISDYLEYKAYAQTSQTLSETAHIQAIKE